MSKIAIIPAKGRSTRLPGKNMKIFNGKPLIAWTLEAAKNSKIFKEIIVSTDHDEIAEISKSFGATIIVKRPPQYADDFATSADVVSHVLEETTKSGPADYELCYLQPTSPLRTSSDIIETSKILDKKNIRNVISVSEQDHPLEWSFKLDETKSMVAAASRITHARSQDYTKAYRLNGAIYWLTQKHFEHYKSLITPNHSIAYVMDKKKSVDIDTIDDFNYAEYLMMRGKT